MLISIYRLLGEYSRYFNVKPITGILHIGAHECEEYRDYVNIGIPPSRMIWFEAQSELVDKARKMYPDTTIYSVVLSDTDDEKRDFIITNNYMSSSLLELKDHLIEHPHIHEIRRDTVKTITFSTFVQQDNLNLVGYNFINLDIQGHELPVLKGMREHLNSIDYIYCEVNIKELYQGCALLPELDSYLAEKGFIRMCIELTPHGWGDAFYIRM